MKNAFKVTGVIACFAAVLALSGAQWMALQSYAWVRMTVQFSHQDTLVKALAKTLSGRHPCALCLKVQKGIQEEQQKDQKTGVAWEKLPEVIWELRCLTHPPVPESPRQDTFLVSSVFFEFFESPPTPPPRA